jgi:hypothetical protein
MRGFTVSLPSTHSIDVKGCFKFGKVVRIRGVQIRSETDPIGFVRISEPKYSFRIGLIKLFRSRIGSDFDIRNKMN